MGSGTQWTSLQDVIMHINNSSNPASEMTACMVFILALVKLDTSQMSDAIQEAFVAHEAALRK